MSERALESYTVVLLRRPPDAPELPEEELDRAGRIVVDVFTWLIPPGLARFGA